MTIDAEQALEVDVHLALDGFDLELAFRTSHPVTGLFGASGSGKTSLLEAIAGLRRLARGRVRQGSDVWLDSAAGRFVPPERRGIGYVPQDGLLFPHLSVRGNLLSGIGRAARRGGPQGTGHTGRTGRRDTVFDGVVELLELQALLERPVPTLSGGERQRVALGRAICSGPRLLLLDEPLAALDLGLRRRLLPFLRRASDEFHIPSLLVSHDPIEMLALCDDLIALHEGRAIARGRPRDVLTDPAVYPLGDHQSFENVLVGSLVESRQGTSRVRLAGSAQAVEVVTVEVDGRAGQQVMLGLPAHEIMIATELPRGLSARNALPARVTRLQQVGKIELVTASLSAPSLDGPVDPAAGAPELTVEVTDTTTESLGLAPGGEIYLIFKATSCRVFGARTPRD